MPISKSREHKEGEKSSEFVREMYSLRIRRESLKEAKRNRLQTSEG